MNVQVSEYDNGTNDLPGPHGGRQDPWDAWRPRGTLYTMTSLGPDKIDQSAWSYPHPTAYTVRYNMSGGLQSKGDIYMSNHGLVF